MTDDRLGDLGADRPRSAAERFAELDEREARQQRPREPSSRPSGRYAWVVGIAFLIAIAAAMLNAIRTEGPGALGPEPGSQLPAFAAPLASAGLELDANVRRDGAGSACSVDRPDAVNVCRLHARQPVVVSFMFTRLADCEPQLDRIERARRAVPEVAWVGVVVREQAADARRLVRERGWRFPVALDRDGQVSNVYGIGGCPTTVFARRGGEVRATRIGQLSEAELVREARALLAPGR